MENQFAVASKVGETHLKALLEYRDKRHVDRSNEVVELNKKQARIDQCNLDLEHCEQLIQIFLQKLSDPELPMGGSDCDPMEVAWSNSFLDSASGERPMANDVVARLLHQTQHARLDSVGEGYGGVDGLKASPSSLVGRMLNIHDELSETSGMDVVLISNERPYADEQLPLVTFLVIDVIKGRGLPCEGSRDTGADVNLIAESCARALSAWIYHSATPMWVKPWAGGDRPVKTYTHCWLLVKFQGRRTPFWINFCVFEDNIMGNDHCIFSVKTCIKSSLIIDGLMC